MKKPERRIVLQITIGADSWSDAAEAVNSIAERIEREGPITTLISGGWSSGYVADGKENENQTGDNYRIENAEYVKQLRNESA